MYSVKWEPGVEICRGCLSTDRRLSSLANYDLFFTLLNDSQKLEALKSPALLLCWECNAALRRVKLFRTQVQHVHRLLEEAVDHLPIQGLSQLSICHKQDYDVVIEDVPDCIEEEIIIPIKEEKTHGQTDAFNQNLNLDENHDFEDVDDFESHIQLDLELETEDNSLDETNKTPLRKSKRKRKIVRNVAPLPTNIKIKSFETDTIKKIYRKGLRSSGEVIPPLYPLNKNNANKKDIRKKKIKTNNKVKREFRQSKRKRRLNFKDPSQTVNKVMKENKTPDSSVNAAKDLQNDVTNDDKAEASTDSQLEYVGKYKPVNNPEEKVEIDNIAQSAHSNEDDSETANTDEDDPGFDEDDPDFEELKKDKNERVKNKIKEAATKDNSDFEKEFRDNPNERVKIKEKGVSTRDSCFNCVCISFDITTELDEYFTKVDLSPEEVKDILNNELSYNNEQRPYGCEYCGFCFQLTRSLLQHRRTRHKTIAKCKNPVYLMYRCNICRKIIRMDHAEAHMKYLHRWRYYCKECDKDFWDLAEGKSHFEEAHREAKGQSCGLCRYVTNTKRAMERHMKDRHTSMPCDICGKLLHGADYLRRHKRIRHQPDGSAPEQRYCVSCDKQFETVLAYEYHLRYSVIHRDKPRERIPCTECGKLLKNKLSVKYHYDRYHNNKTRFQCPLCDKYYSRNTGLRKHIKSVHQKVKVPKDKLCTICGRAFSSNRILVHHMRTHTGERPHECPHCPAAFAQPFPLRKHVATQHPQAPKTQSEAPVAQELAPYDKTVRPPQE